MYCVHALAWTEAEATGLEKAEGEDLVRRCEAVLAAIHFVHDPHRIDLSSAHGEDRVGLFFSHDSFDLARAAAPGNGISQSGFAGVYQGPCVRLGALSADSPPRPGPRAESAPLREGLGELLELARRDALSLDALQAATHLCLCEVANGADGRWLRRILLEDAEEGRADDRNRQLTCLLLLDTLHEQPSSDPVRTFRERWAFGDPLGETAGDERATVATLWRAAALRNYSVGAWRALWRWLAQQLNEQEMTVEQLGDRLGDALGDLTVAEMIDDLPPRADGATLLPAEAQIADEEWTALSSVRQLATGAGRLEDLDDVTLKAFVGPDPQDLGPRWVAGLLEEWRDRPLRSVAGELAVILVRRAKRVSLSKMYVTRDGKPFVPTRLRDRNGLLSVRGEEGAGDVALRTDTLADVLAGLGVLAKDDAGVYAVTDHGEELRARIA